MLSNVFPCGLRLLAPLHSLKPAPPLPLVQPCRCPARHPLFALPCRLSARFDPAEKPLGTELACARAHAYMDYGLWTGGWTGTWAWWNGSRRPPRRRWRRWRPAPGWRRTLRLRAVHSLRDLRPLACCTALRSLDLSRCRTLEGSSLAPLSCLTGLTCLNLNNRLWLITNGRGRVHRARASGAGRHAAGPGPRRPSLRAGQRAQPGANADAAAGPRPVVLRCARATEGGELVPS